MRDAASARLHLRVRSIGQVAADLLVSGAHFEVEAVFERSCYLRLASGFVCVGAADIGKGPINALIDLPEGVGFAGLGIGRDDEGSIGASGIMIDDGPVIALAAVEPWAPPPFPTQLDRRTIASGLATLRHAIEAEPVGGGLAGLVFDAARWRRPTRFELAAADLMTEMRARLPQAIAETDVGGIAPHAVLLLGLGPGLTPSGDDVLGGMLLALSALQETIFRDALWEALVPELGDLTNEISAMHLAVAADGLGADAVHRLINAALIGDAADIARHAKTVTAIGDSSGFDIMAGIVLATTAWVEAPLASGT